MSTSSSAGDYWHLVSHVRDRVEMTLQELCKDMYNEDVERVRTDDCLLHQYLRHHQGNTELTVRMLTYTLVWRRMFRVRDITEDSIPTALWKKSMITLHNKDKEGNPLLLMHLGRRRRGEMVKDTKRLLVHYLESSHQYDPEHKITLIMDYTGVTLASLDTEFIKFVICCFQSYYPNFLKLFINYETPWIYTAGWRFIRTLFKEEDRSKKLVRFECRRSIGQYATPDQLPPHMGGTDERFCESRQVATTEGI